MGFNSRTLGRVRLSYNPDVLLLAVVSIHAPWEGCDVRSRTIKLVRLVSIHAPWEGCDV